MEVKVIQGKYNLGWEDELVYTKEQYHLVDKDLAEYAKTGRKYRIVTRQIKTKRPRSK